MQRSLKVHPDFIPTVKLAFRRRGYPKQVAFARELGFARSTVHNFLNGNSVERWHFVKMCEKLELDWQTIAGLDTAAPEEANNAPAPLPTSTEHDERIESIAKRNAEILVTLFKNIRSQLPSDVSDEVVADLAKAALSEAKDYSGSQLDETEKPQ